MALEIALCLGEKGGGQRKPMRKLTLRDHASLLVSRFTPGFHVISLFIAFSSRSPDLFFSTYFNLNRHARVLETGGHTREVGERVQKDGYTPKCRCIILMELDVHVM